MYNPAFTPESLIIDGKILPARYAIAENDTVYAYVTSIEYGEECHLTITLAPDHEHHAAAMAAAVQALRPETILEERPPKRKSSTATPKRRAAKSPKSCSPGLRSSETAGKSFSIKHMTEPASFSRKCPAKPPAKPAKTPVFTGLPRLSPGTKS